jgi:hypothetical protein
LVWAWTMVDGTVSGIEACQFEAVEEAGLAGVDHP